MSHTLIEETVDIYELPTVNNLPLSKDSEITIGDLHGNAIKLLFTLIKHGIAKNVTKDQYEKLVSIYNTYDLTNSDIEKFDNILSEITFQSDGLLRLLGDELADRGANDYFTLKIIQKLHESNVPFEIIISNHSMLFIEYYEQKKAFSSNEDMQFGSMTRLGTLLDKGLVTDRAISTIVTDCYKPHLKALSCLLHEKAITIYSHAPIGLEIIETLAQELKVTYKDANLNELKSTIDNINQAFCNYVNNNQVHTLCYKKGNFGFNSETAFYWILWNRTDDEACPSIERLANHNDYSTIFVHGHDSDTVEEKHIHNLDNTLGKKTYNSNGNEGIYTALCSNMSPPLIQENNNDTSSQSISESNSTSNIESNNENNNQHEPIQIENNNDNKQPPKKPSYSLMLRFLSHPGVKAGGFILLVLGVAACILSTAGIVPAILGMTAAATAATSVITGIATGSTGAGLLLCGIFASFVKSRKDRALTSNEQPNNL